MSTDFAFAAIYNQDGIFESIVGIPIDQVSSYSTGNEMLFEILDSYEQVPLDQLAPGKIIKRVGVKRYEVQDAP